MSEAYDLVGRNAHAIAAADAQQCDIGVRGERIVALADRLDPCRRNSYCERD